MPQFTRNGRPANTQRVKVSKETMAVMKGLDITSISPQSVSQSQQKSNDFATPSPSRQASTHPAIHDNPISSPTNPNQQKLMDLEQQVNAQMTSVRRALNNIFILENAAAKNKVLPIKIQNVKNKIAMLEKQYDAICNEINHKNDETTDLKQAREINSKEIGRLNELEKRTPPGQKQDAISEKLYDIHLKNTTLEISIEAMEEEVWDLEEKLPDIQKTISEQHDNLAKLTKDLKNSNPEASALANKSATDVQQKLTELKKNTVQLSRLKTNIINEQDKSHKDESQKNHVGRRNIMPLKGLKNAPASDKDVMSAGIDFLQNAPTPSQTNASVNSISQLESDASQLGNE